MANFQKTAAALQKKTLASLMFFLMLSVLCSLPAAANPDFFPPEKLNRRIIDLYNAGRYEEAMPLAVRSYRLVKLGLGENHPRMILALNNLAELQRKTGNYADAEALLLRSLKISLDYLEKDHPAIATLLNNLALLYENQGNHSEAESLYQRSLKIRKKALGPKHPKVAELVSKLAALNQERFP